MDLKELGISVIEILIASIPMLITLLATFNAKNERINKNITTFNVDNKKTSEKLSKLIDENFKKIVNDNNNFNMITVARVDTFLENSNETLDNYSSKLDRLTQGVEMTLNISQAFMETIVDLMRLDDNLIQQKVFLKMDDRVKELKDNNKNLVSLYNHDIKEIKDNLREFIELFGLENLNNVIKEISNEERKEEEL